MRVSNDAMLVPPPPETVKGGYYHLKYIFMHHYFPCIPQTRNAHSVDTGTSVALSLNAVTRTLYILYSNRAHFPCLGFK